MLATSPCRISTMPVSQLSNERIHELLEKCTIDALIPLTANLSLDDLLSDVHAGESESGSRSLATKAPQKETLFFGSLLFARVP